MDEKLKYEKKIIGGKCYLKLGQSSDFFEKKGKKFVLGEEFEEQVAVFRFDGNLHAFDNICPHRHQDQIYNGIIDGRNLVCPLHGWTYSLETGQNIILKQGIKSLKKYNIIEQDGFVYLEQPVFQIPVWKSKDIDNEL